MIGRIERQEAAELIALAFHDPKRLGVERRAVMDMLARPLEPHEELDAIAAARALAEAIDRGKVRAGRVMRDG